MNNQQIESCVHRTEQGDTKAFEELYIATNQRVYFICLHFLKNEHDANDALQDTYLSAYKNIRNLSEPSKFSSWVERIAVNVCKNYLKKKNPSPVEDDTLIEILAAEEELILPDKYIDDAEKRRVLLEIMQNTLSDLQYRTVILYYFGNFTAHETAEMMDCTEGAVKNRLATARAKIKKAIEEYQKDKDNKLFVFAGVPFLAKVFDEESKTLTAPALNTAMLTGTAAAASTTASASAGAAVKTGGFVMSKKILIGIIAGVVAVGAAGTAIGIAVFNNNSGGNTASVGNASSSDNKGGSNDNTAAPDGNTGLSGGNTEQNNAAAAKVEELGLHNPRDPETEEVSFSYVYFGSYPQTEIAAKETKRTDADVDPELFSKLEAATDWDSNNDTVIDGIKYRRSNNERIDNIRNITYSENKEVSSYQPDYTWFDTDNPEAYHYFRYEPVKWRVLEISGDDLLLAAEKEIDVITYGDNISHIENGETFHNLASSWKNSRARSFINGLGPAENIAKSDFEGKGVLQTLFTEEEKSCLTPFTAADGTSDLLVIPSLDDYSGDNGYQHGFAKKKTKQDSKRKSFSTDYAAYDYRTVLLRDDPHQANDTNKTPAAYAVKSDGSIGTSYQEIVCGIVPMVRISVNCPHLQKAESDE